jgi:hypothetical protein
MTDRNRSYGRPLVDGLHCARWRFDFARLRGLLREGGIAFGCGRRRRNRAWQTDQCFSRSERHCMHGIGIGVCHENSDTARARDQPEDYEGKDEAKLAVQSRGETDIPEFGMQITH